MDPNSKVDLVDYDQLMRANLTDVFGEFDAGKRLGAIRGLYAKEAVLNDPESSARGHAAINAAVTALLSRLPPGFVFRALGPAIGHHNTGRLRWQLGPSGGPVAVTGMDIAHFEGNVIQALFVFIEPNNPSGTRGVE